MRYLAGLFGLFLLAAGPSVSAQPTAFRFVHISGRPVGNSTSAKALEGLLTSLGKMTSPPRFVVNTGSVTARGSNEEFAAYLEVVRAAGIPFHQAPGSSDVRGPASGKRNFTEAFKQRYHSFNEGGCHFVVLDSTVAHREEGHLDKPQLKWLANDLKKQRDGAPIFVFLHHAVGQRSVEVDNSDDLMRILAPYHVVAMFVGGESSEVQWKANGIACFSDPRIWRGGYHLVDVGTDEIVVYRVRTDSDASQPQKLATLAREAPLARKIASLWDDPEIPLLERRRILAELRVGDKGAHDERVKAEYAVDDDSFKVMERDTRDRESVSFIAQFRTEGMQFGTHELRLRFTAPDGEVFMRSESFRVERVSGSPKRLWDELVEVGDSIQGSPTLDGNTVYVGAVDGRVYAFAADSGKRRWAAAIGAPIIGSCVVSGGLVFVGSHDGMLYAISASSGAVRWKFDCGEAVSATPAVLGDIVCIGVTGKIIGINTATGKRAWVTEVAGSFVSQVTVAGGAFILGGTDTLYCVDAITGAIKWRSTMEHVVDGNGSVFYTSLAESSPAVSGDRVYVCSSEGVLICLSASTGKRVWARSAPDSAGRIGSSSPVVNDGKVFVSGSDGKGQGELYGFDAATGLPLWRCATGTDSSNASPVVSDGMLALSSRDSTLSWVDSQSGKLIAQYRVENAFSFSTPAFAGRTAYLPAMNGTLTAVRLP